MRKYALILPVFSYFRKYGIPRHNLFSKYESLSLRRSGSMKQSKTRFPHTSGSQNVYAGGPGKMPKYGMEDMTRNRRPETKCQTAGGQP